MKWDGVYEPQPLTEELYFLKRGHDLKGRAGEDLGGVRREYD